MEAQTIESTVPAVVTTKTAEPAKARSKAKTAELVADVNSPAYELGQADANNEVDAIEAFISVMTEAGPSGYKQARLDYTAGRIAAGDDEGYARTRFYRQMKAAKLTVPGKQGKRKEAKEPEAVDTSKAAWLACYDTADWTMARRIMARLTADAKA